MAFVLGGDCDCCEVCGSTSDPRLEGLRAAVEEAVGHLERREAREVVAEMLKKALEASRR